MKTGAPAAILTENLSKHFEVPVKRPGLVGALQSFVKKEHKLVEAVKEISFSIEQGELVGFLGPNGAGKTTTLKMLSGLLYPTSGKLSVLGFVPWKRQRAFQKNFSMVMGQRTQLWWDLPARETFVLNQKIYEIPDAEFRQIENELVEFLEIKDIVKVPVKKLSLGERMKAELACALLHRPKLLLLDEPSLGLDVVMQKKLRQFIRDYNRRYSATILLTSHNMSDVEELCKRVLVIDNGQLLYDGNLQTIVERYAPDKILALSSSETLQADALKQFGRLLFVDGTSAKMEIPRKEISKIVGRILAQIPVVDLTIEELSVEEIIRRVFVRTPAAPSERPATDNLQEPAESKKPALVTPSHERFLP